MTAASDNPSSGGDFDLSGFKAKPRKKAEGDASATPKSPREYGESKPRAPRSESFSGPKRTAKLPDGFKSRERDERPDRPRAFRKGPEAGDAPRKKFASDFRPREGDRPFKKFDGPRKPYGAGVGAGGDRPSRPYGDKPAFRKPFDGPRKPYGERSADNERPSRSFGGGDRPFKKFDGPRKPYGASAGGDRPARPYGDRGDKPAFRKPFDKGGDRPFKKFDGPRGGAGGGYPGSRDATARPAPAPFVPELSPDVKKFLPLLTEKGRHKESRFIIEGAKNVADVAEHSPDIIHTVLVAEGFQDAALKERLDALRLRTRLVAESDLSALCGTETPQGIVAIANFGSLRPEWTSINTVTLLDGVQDPGNLGAILRTSAALGMEAVVLGKGTCDPYNPKVVRASAAALLRMPLETGEDLAMKIHFLRSKGFTIVATSPHAKVTLEQAKLRRKVALLFGSEGGGVGANLIDQADVSVRIPMKGKVESLNVAVAHGLLAYDLMRLRT